MVSKFKLKYSLIKIFLLFFLFFQILFADQEKNTNPYLSIDGQLIDISNFTNSIPKEFTKTVSEEIDFFIINFKGNIQKYWFDILKEKNIKVLWYVPYYSYIIKMQSYDLPSLESLPFVNAIIPYQPYFKMSPEIKKLLKSNNIEYFHKNILIKIILFKDEPIEPIINYLTNHLHLKIKSKIITKIDSRIIVEIQSERIKEFVKDIVFWKEVEGIELYHKLEYTNDAARWVHQQFIADYFPLYDNNLLGQGQIGAISDSGFDYDMCYFYDPLNEQPPVDVQEPWGDVEPNYDARKVILYYAMDAFNCGEMGSPGADYPDNDHGTHTAVSFAGNNYNQSCLNDYGSAGDGIALCSKVIMQDLGPILNFINNECGTLYDLLYLSYKDGARVQSNSWGYGCYGCPCVGNFYNPDTRDLDQFVWEHKDMTVFFSAGNSASSCPDSTVCAPGVAKNCVTVGASKHDLQANDILPSSSRGWTYDKRLKPDLIAQGKDVISADNDGENDSFNCSLKEMSGTSMACPIASGYGILTRQYYADGYYPSGSPNPANSLNPSAALIKATMINGAVDMTEVNSPPPNITEGWGRLQLDEALHFPDDSKQLIVFDEKDGLATNWSKCYYIENINANNPLKVSLTWTDYPASLYANPALVNDLMLELIDPQTTSYHQALDYYFNIIQTTNPLYPQDNRNNVEQLTIDTPAAGIWKIKVTGINIPFALQPYAVVATGSINSVEQPQPPENIGAVADADNQITLSWNTISSAQCYNIYRNEGTCSQKNFYKIADCIPDNYFIDDEVSGGSIYSYKITAIYDNFCESEFSECVEVSAKGICTLAPNFSGIKTIINNKSSPCSLTIQWDAAESNCPQYPEITYSIFKSLTRKFTPSANNLIASCLSQNSFTDYDVASGLTFYYIVRAEDSRQSGGSGYCNNGNSDSNLNYHSILPTGTETILYYDDAGDTTTAKMTLGENWSISTQRNNTPNGSHSYYSGTEVNKQCSSITSPSILLIGGSYFVLEFYTYYDIEEAWDAGVIEISTDDGISWVKLTPTQGYPHYTINTDSCIGKYTPAFTGKSNDWIYYNADLTPYGEKQIKFRFKYGSDSYVNRENWYIDDIKISALSPCLNGSPNCSTPPLFNGLYIATSTELSTCSNYLHWKSAQPTCINYPNVKYHIYRSTNPFFSPSPSNRIASCIVPTYFIDDNVEKFTNYYYIVRAEDSSQNGNGPCNAGNSDLNTTIKNANPSTHTILSDNFENDLSNWIVSGNWQINKTRYHSPFQSAASGNVPNQCDTLTLNQPLLPGNNADPSISFWTIYSTENNRDGGIVESSTDNINWTRIELIPSYPSIIQESNICIQNNTPSFSGKNSSWVYYTSSSIPYIPNQSLHLRFLYASNDSNNEGGWFIDDVSIKMNEDCTTKDHPPGTIPDNDNFAGTPLKISKDQNNLMLTWGAPLGACLNQYYDYAIYEGSLPIAFYNHLPLTCTTNGNLSYTIQTDSLNHYYLVVAVYNGSEGSYGISFPDAQRPASISPCYSQSIGNCNLFANQK